MSPPILQSHADQQGVQCVARVLLRHLPQRARVVCRLEFGTEAFVFALVDGKIVLSEGGLLRPRQFPAHQVRNEGKFEGVVERQEIGLNFSGPHEPDACEQDPIHIEKRFHTARRFLCKQIPLRLCKPKVVVRVMLGDAAFGDLLQLRVLRRRVDDER